MHVIKETMHEFFSSTQPNFMSPNLSILITTVGIPNARFLELVVPLTMTLLNHHSAVPLTQ